MDDRIAKSEKDVRRLAPTPGAYWVRETEGDYREWRVVLRERWGETFDWSALGTDESLSDADFIGAEIVGPIPEPA